MDINELDFSNIGSWPLPVRISIIAVAFIGVIAAGWYFDWTKQLESLEKQVKKEDVLKDEFVAKLRKAVNLEAYENQLDEMRQEFGAMLRQLPSKSEIEALIEDFSQTGLASGLEFELFKRGREEAKEFYGELAIRIRVVGSYHEFGKFVSGVAALPRIVTLHNVTISPVGGRKKSADSDEQVLVMEATAKTYRYLDDEESEGS